MERKSQYYKYCDFLSTFPFFVILARQSLSIYVCVGGGHRKKSETPRRAALNADQVQSCSYLF